MKEKLYPIKEGEGVGGVYASSMGNVIVEIRVRLTELFSVY
jgi:hypothetical protein